MRARDFPFCRQSSGTASRILEFPGLPADTVFFSFYGTHPKQGAETEKFSVIVLPSGSGATRGWLCSRGFLRRIFFFFMETIYPWIFQGMLKWLISLIISSLFYLKWNFLPLPLLGNHSVWKAEQLGQRQESAAPQSADSPLIPVLRLFAADGFCDQLWYQEMFLAIVISWSINLFSDGLI